MSQEKSGFFKHPWGGKPPEPNPLHQDFRSQWDDLSARVCPDLSNPNSTFHFFQFSQQLDRWVREWGAVADRENDQRLRELIAQAHESLKDLLNEAKQLFERERSDRVALQQQQDRQRWAVEQANRRRLEEEAERRRRKAESDALLQKTNQEIADIYSSIAASRRESAARQNAMWRSAHFPETTCACGRSKISNQPCCWDCANRGRTFFF